MQTIKSFFESEDICWPNHGDEFQVVGPVDSVEVLNEEGHTRTILIVGCVVKHGCIKKTGWIPVSFIANRQVLNPDGSKAYWNSTETAMRELTGVPLRFYRGHSDKGRAWSFFRRIPQE